MREIYFNSDINDRTADELKLLTLYYDKVNVVNDCIYTIESDKEKNEIVTKDIPFIPESFSNDYNLLINEGILSVTKRDETIKDDQFAKEISKIVNSNHDYIFPIHPKNSDTIVITEEVYSIMNNLLNLSPGQPINKDVIWWYYSFKLNWSLKLLLDGHNCLTSSNNLNFLFEQLLKQLNFTNKKLDKSTYKKSLAVEAIKLKLPNPSMLNFEDILELKHKLKNELLEFSYVINSIEIKNKDFFRSSELSDKDYSTIFYNEIQKPLKDLEIKLKNLNSKTYRGLIESLKNPKSFAPLIGTVVASLPIQYTLLTSLGMIASQSYLQFKEEKREITNNGLYFLLKL